ncbi:peptide-binding protein [Candidatus Margulisiibacteriota bacterium]
MKKYILLYTFLGLLFINFGCNNQSYNNNINQFLKLRLNAEPSLLNPILSTDVYSSEVEGLVFNGLFRINSDLELIPDLAEKYKINPNGTEYTFYLRKDVFWHDGQKFTAEDVKFTFDKILDPKTNTVRRNSFIIDGNPVQFIVIDEYTIKAVLPKPFSPFLIRVSMSILPKHLLEKENINKTAFNRNPIGTGPFVFKVWESGQFIKLTRNENYYRGKAKLQGVLFKIIPDTNTGLVALEKGEVDYAGIPAKDYKRILTKKNLNIFKYQQLQYSYLGFNLKNEFFSNKNIRQAIALAINKEAIVQSVYKGLAKPAYLPSSPVLWAYPDNFNPDQYRYNPSKCKELLNKADFALNPDIGILEKNGKVFEFDLFMGKGNKTGEKTAQIIQRYLANIGIKMNIRIMEWRSLLKIIQEPIENKKFDAVMMGWSLGIDPDSYTIWHSSQFPKGFNFIGYQNKKVDTLLEQGRAKFKKENRKKVYAKLYQEIVNDMPYVFLFYPDTIVGVNKRVKGLSKPGPAGVLNEIEAVFIE